MKVPTRKHKMELTITTRHSITTVGHSHPLPTSKKSGADAKKYKNKKKN
jgi:hypothetical protein